MTFRPLLLIWLPTVLAGQAPKALGPASATSSERFTEVTGLVELDGGGILVGDQRENRLVLLNLDRGTSRPVASVGSGPREFRSFGTLLPSPGGGAYATDFAQRRVLPIGPDGAPQEVRSYPNALGNILRGIDARGRLYSVSFVWGGTPRVASDSMDIIRWDPVTNAVDTLVRYDAGVTKWTGRQMEAQPAINDWVVLGDGRVVILDATTYRVTAYDGRQRGQVKQVPFTALPFRESDRREHAASMDRSPRRLMGNGSSAGGTRPAIDWRYPKHFPAFVRNGVRVDRAGRIWVERSRSLTDSVVVFDVLGSDFGRIASVALPRRATIAGFGRESIYLAVPNEDDELAVQRHPMPVLSSR